MKLLDEICAIGITENREASDIAYGKPTACKMTVYEGQTVIGSYKNHRITIEMREGYSIRIEISEKLYNSLSETKTEEGEE